MNRCKIMQPNLCTAEVPSTLGEDGLAKSQNRAERGSTNARGMCREQSQGVWCGWFCFGWSLVVFAESFSMYRDNKVKWGWDIHLQHSKQGICGRKSKVCHSLREMSTIISSTCSLHIFRQMWLVLSKFNWFPNISMAFWVTQSIPIHGYPWLKGSWPSLWSWEEGVASDEFGRVRGHRQKKTRVGKTKSWDKLQLLFWMFSFLVGVGDLKDMLKGDFGRWVYYFEIKRWLCLCEMSVPHHYSKNYKQIWSERCGVLSDSCVHPSMLKS